MSLKWVAQMAVMHQLLPGRPDLAKGLGPEVRAYVKNAGAIVGMEKGFAQGKPEPIQDNTD